MSRFRGRARRGAVDRGEKHTAGGNPAIRDFGRRTGGFASSPLGEFAFHPANIAEAYDKCQADRPKSARYYVKSAFVIRSDWRVSIGQPGDAGDGAVCGGSPSGIQAVSPLTGHVDHLGGRLAHAVSEHVHTVFVQISRIDVP